MRIAIAVAMVLALAACSRPGGQYLAGDGGSATTVSGELAGVGSVSEGATTQQESTVSTTTVGAQATPTTADETSPEKSTTTVASASQATPTTTTTTTTLAVLTVDPQEVESALAELDALLSSLGSAMSAMEQAFEQGE